MIDVDDRDAGQAGRHEHQGEIPVARGFRIGAHEAEDVVGDAGAGAPALRPVQDEHPAVGRPPCRRRDAGEVAADVGLGEAVGEEQLTPCDARQQRALLRRRAVLADVESTVEGAVDVRPRERGPPAGELVDHGDGSHDVAPRAAVLLGDGETADARRRQPVEDLPREHPLAVPPSHRLARHLALDETADRVAQLHEVRGLVDEGGHGGRALTRR